MIVERRHHSGPVPSPEDLAAYDRVLPGLANRLVAITETVIANENRIAADRLNAETTDASSLRAIQGRGQHYALIFVLVALALAAAFVFTGHVDAGIELMKWVIGTVVVAFLGGKAARIFEKRSGTESDDATEAR